MAKQFYAQLFKTLEEEAGAELENIVYTKSHASHYFVMTPTPRCLIKTGVVKDKNCKPLLARGNIDVDRLDKFVRDVCAFQFKKVQEAAHVAASTDAGVSKPGYADSGPMLFDFSKMRRSAEGITFVFPPGCSPQNDDGDENSGDDNLLIGLVGDVLIEPFWPEGLGIIRGFFCSARFHLYCRAVGHRRQPRGDAAAL